jgi:hypothetical protein
MYVFYFTLTLTIKYPYQPIAPSTPIFKARKTKEVDWVQQLEANGVIINNSDLIIKRAV